MSLRRIAAASFAICVAAGDCEAASAGPCLGYSAPVSLTGRLRRRTYPGRPNYESVARGDEPETLLVLQLDRPACVAADPADSSGLSPAIPRVSVVQLATTGRVLGAVVGRRVSVSGRIMAAITGHHHTPILLEGVTLGR